MSIVELKQDSQSHDIQLAISRANQISKRLLDLAICLVCLPFIVPLMGIIAILIVLDSPGSPFFIQERIGLGGRSFRMIKFRTMHSDYDSPEDRNYMKAYIAGLPIPVTGTGAKSDFKPNHKNHITRLGHLLRKSSLDELPQLINVIKGEMSIVGPRPNVPWEYEAYAGWHYKRLSILPGITGLAQVRGRSNLTFDDIVRSDIEYIEQYSLLLDLQILWKTVFIVLKMVGAG
jgi:lipopolysaccharide/colanic/teichoic acid biosynthesis glycosyltransferase